MLNSQWNLYFDPEVLAYDDTDGVNQTGIYYEGELLGYELNISPVAIEDGYIINTGKVDIGEIHGNNSNAYPVYELKREDNSKIGFVTVTFKVLNPNADTTVYLELVELLTNKGQITLRVTLDEPKGQLLFAVIDTGIGVPEEARERIFERFEKVDSFKEGIGLGLCVSRSLARRMGGDVTLADSSSQGSTFLLTIPL